MLGQNYNSKTYLSDYFKRMTIWAWTREGNKYEPGGSTTAQVTASAVWLESHCLTCDVCCHQSFRPDDLHLHHTDILQVVEGPPHALKHYRDGLKGQRETQISTEEKVRSIAWHFIKRREGTICPLTALIWKSTVVLAFVVESNRGQMAKFNFI